MMTTNTSSVRSKAELIIETAAFLPLTAAALLGNTLVLTAIYRNLRLRTTAHYFIATLALTDLLSACISQPLTVSTLLSGQWLTGTVGCHIHGFFNSFLTYTSSYTMVLTAVNRYFKVVRPRLYPRYLTKMRVVSLLVSIWIINIVVVLAPVLGGWARFEFTDMFRACVVKFPPNREASWAGFEFTVFSLIPMITISFCYYKVSKTIQQHNHITLASLQARSTGMNVEEIRVTKTLFSLVFVFFACMFGGFIMVVVCRVVAGAILDCRVHAYFSNHSNNSSKPDSILVYQQRLQKRISANNQVREIHGCVAAISCVEPAQTTSTTISNQMTINER